MKLEWKKVGYEYAIPIDGIVAIRESDGEIKIVSLYRTAAGLTEEDIPRVLGEMMMEMHAAADKEENGQ